MQTTIWYRNIEENSLWKNRLEVGQMKIEKVNILLLYHPRIFSSLFFDASITAYRSTDSLRIFIFLFDPGRRTPTCIGRVARNAPSINSGNKLAQAVLRSGSRSLSFFFNKMSGRSEQSEYLEGNIGIKSAERKIDKSKAKNFIWFWYRGKSFIRIGVRTKKKYRRARVFGLVVQDKRVALKLFRGLAKYNSTWIVARRSSCPCISSRGD